MEEDAPGKTSRSTSTKKSQLCGFLLVSAVTQTVDTNWPTSSSYKSPRSPSNHPSLSIYLIKLVLPARHGSVVLGRSA
jgi:hypothetical protein